MEFLETYGSPEVVGRVEHSFNNQVRLNIPGYNGTPLWITGAPDNLDTIRATLREVVKYPHGSAWRYGSLDSDGVPGEIEVSSWESVDAGTYWVGIDGTPVPVTSADIPYTAPEQPPVSIPEGSAPDSPGWMIPAAIAAAFLFFKR